MNLAKNSSAHLPETSAQRFSVSLARGDTRAVARVIDELLATQRSLPQIYFEVIAPALVSIGDSWCNGEIGVGDEHLATQIVLEQMDRLRSLFVTPEPRSPYRVLVACVEGEQHFLGARMIADLCLLKGWAVDFLGANTPAGAIVDMARRRHTDLVGLSATMSQGFKQIERLLVRLGALSPAPNVVLGGRVFADNAAPRRIRRSCAIAHDGARGMELIGKFLRAGRPKAMLKEHLLTLARRVRELRIQKGWTQEELANATRVTRVCIVAVEGGKQNVSMDVLVRLANALSVAPELLLASNPDRPMISTRRRA